MSYERESSNLQWLELIHIAIVDVFRHFRSIIMVSLILAIVADVFFTLRYEPLYRSEATFALKMDDQYELPTGGGDIEEISNAFGYIISSNIFKTKIMEDLGVRALDGYYETSVLQDTNIIKISAVSHEPKVAYLMMNSMIHQYREISNLVLGDVNIELLQNITIPTQPFNQLNHKRTLVKFGGIGMLGAIFVIGLLSFFSTSVKVKEDFEKMQLPLLGSLSKESKFYRKRLGIQKKKNILITQMSTSFRYIEMIKKIRYKVENKGCHVLMVTSSLENEGKTSVAANLALALKENHKKVLLIDCDLIKPALYKIFGLVSNDGIMQVISGETDFISAITHGGNGIDFLLGKTSYQDAAERIESGAFKNFIQKVRDEYDYVVIDSAPSALFSDSTSLAELCDGYLLVIKQNFVRQRIVEEVVEKFSLSRATLIGCVLNSKLEISFHRRKSSGSRYGYRYGYGYHYHKKYEDGENDG